MIFSTKTISISFPVHTHDWRIYNHGVSNSLFGIKNPDKAKRRGLYPIKDNEENIAGVVLPQLWGFATKSIKAWDKEGAFSDFKKWLYSGLERYMLVDVDVPIKDNAFHVAEFGYIYGYLVNKGFSSGNRIMEVADICCEHHLKHKFNKSMFVVKKYAEMSQFKKEYILPIFFYEKFIPLSNNVRVSDYQPFLKNYVDQFKNNEDGLKRVFERLRFSEVDGLWPWVLKNYGIDLSEIYSRYVFKGEFIGGENAINKWSANI